MSLANFAAALDYVRPRKDGVPSGVSLPNYFIEGPLTWPGQYAGFLGVRHDPWQINQDPNSDNFKVDELSLPTGMTNDAQVRHSNPGTPASPTVGTSGICG